MHFLRLAGTDLARSAEGLRPHDQGGIDPGRDQAAFTILLSLRHHPAQTHQERQRRQRCQWFKPPIPYARAF